MGLMDDVKSKKKQKEAENWFNMAIKSPDLERKLDYFTRSLELEPNNVSAWLKRGRILEDMGRFDEAKRSYDRASLLDPALEIHTKKVNPIPEEDRVIAPNTVEEETQYIQEERQYVEDEEEYLPTTSEKSTGSYRVKETEEIVSFIPPKGEESLFSNMKKTDASIPDEESETVEINPEIVKSSGVISFGDSSVEVVPEKIQDSVATKQLLEPKNDEPIKQRDTTVTFDRKETISKIPVASSEKSEILTEKAGVPPYVDVGKENVDLRIPLSETIKFWLVGAVVLLILYMITSRIIG